MNQESIPKKLWICGVTATPLPASLESAIGTNLNEIVNPNGNRLGTSELLKQHKGEQVNRYILYELDSKDKEALDVVIQTYRDLGIPGVLVHPSGRGYHFFGERRPAEVQHELTKRLMRYRTDECTYNTLRVSYKYENENYEPAVWYGPEERPNWCKSLQYFLSRYANNQAEHDFEANIKKVGLRKYFVVTFYPLCPICYETLSKNPQGEAEHYKTRHDMDVRI